MSSGSSIRFGELPSSFDFVKNEQNILKFWKDIDAFQTSLKQSQGKPKYTFYDGPPFATGLPHYGHILAGTIKDTVTRYAHQRGYHVDRYFGWDCHGLPVEHEIDKKLNIKGPTDVMNMGIANYNNECRSIVNRYSSEWKHIVTRLGRWIDFDNDYKTMYPTFMESVWWVCKQIFDKNMIYYGYRVMPFSTKCNTPLSNFEANQNYKDVIDPSVVVCFPLVDDPSVSFLAWTTTPWTLISTMVLTVNPKSIYAKIKEKKTGNVYILMESRINEYFSKKPYEIIEKFPGESLKGTAFVPCFEYFRDWSNEGAFKVLTDYFVSETDGTGVVQCAPAFGEDDYRVCIKHGVCRGGSQVPCPIDETGSFTDKIPEYKGMYFKDADKHILKELKSRKRIFLDSTIKHNYPFCWRSDTPLMYRIVPSWFVKVKEIVPKLLANNKETYWVPEYVKDKRFHNWLESARDWNISRNRFWGTPIPLWVDKDFEEIVCVGSIEELYELSGVKVEDLHREHIDNIKIPSKKNPGTYLSRVSEVFDCWFESGSMPYAQVHYPFKNKNDFEKSFPADFIAEGIDQTRGWFYTLMVISTILFDKPPFKNLIVNGLVLASDGQKMSKRKQNYPDPLEVVNKYGADALRLYLINSPVVRGDCLKFKECGVQNLLKELFIIYYNAFRYLIQNIHIMEKTNGSKFVFNESQLDNVTNIMDKWILSYSQSVINFVHEEMKAYRLYTVVPAVIKFLESLSKWYIRFNKIRFKGDLGVEEQLMSLSTLYLVQYKMSITFSPFIPFMTEYIYQNLLEFKPKATSELEIELEKSVHFQMLPEPRLELIDQRVEKCVQDMQTVVDLARLIRERNVLPIKNPLREIIVITNDEESLDNIRTLEKYILEDLNIYKLTTSNDLKSYGVTCSILPDFQSLGRKFKSQMKSITEELKNLTFDDFNKTKTEGGHITLCEQEIHETDLRFVYNVTGGGDYSAHSSGKFVVLLDLTQDETLKDDLVARELCNRFQKLRKKAHVVPTDNITLTCWGDENCRKVLEKHLDYITLVVKKPVIITNDHSQMPTKIIEVTEKVNDMELKLVLFLKN